MCCDKNLVVKTLEKELTKIDLMQGKFLKPGTEEISLSSRAGSVYGIFVELDSKKLEVFKKELLKNGNIYEDRLDKWKPVEGNFYPLYWGSDQCLGSRLYAHSKSPTGTGTLHLNERTELIDLNVIYGAILCDDYMEGEKKIRSKHLDIYKTITTKK